MIKRERRVMAGMAILNYFQIWRILEWPHRDDSSQFLVHKVMSQRSSCLESFQI
jgi:hypothetical protein